MGGGRRLDGPLCVSTSLHRFTLRLRFGVRRTAAASRIVHFFFSTPTQNQKTPWEVSPRHCSWFSRFSCCSCILHLCLWKKMSAFRRKAESQEQCETKCWRNPDYRRQHSIMSWKKKVFPAANTQFSPVSFTRGGGRCHLPPTLQAWNTTINQRESHQPLSTKTVRKARTATARNTLKSTCV